MKKIFLTGGTGLLGKAFVQNYPVDLFGLTLGTRTKGADFAQYGWQYFDLDTTNSQLDLSGFDIVLHLASNTKNLNADSDIKGIQQLLTCAKKDQVQHFIYMSIVGVDQVPVKYFRTKRKTEQLLMESGLGYSIIRSTQFFEFFEAEVLSKLKNPINIFPNLNYQPIETRLVAQKLIATCQASPTYTIEEIGGSEILSLKKAIQLYQQRKGNKARLFAIPSLFLGKLATALTTDKGMKESCTWEEYLN